MDENEWVEEQLRKIRVMGDFLYESFSDYQIGAYASHKWPNGTVTPLAVLYFRRERKQVHYSLENLLQAIDDPHLREMIHQLLRDS